MTSSNDIPCPKNLKVTKLKESDCISKYVEFPEDTIFMESVAQNDAYKPGVGFIPVQRAIGGDKNNLETHVYTITPSSEKAEHFMGPIEIDGNREITVFGSDLSNDGILWLTAFNRNSVMGFKCDTPENPVPFVEIPNLPSPNDVCIDPDNESVLYVAGGIMKTFFFGTKFSNSAFGVCYKVSLNDDKSSGEVTIQADNMATLAGIEKLGNTLWLCELFQIRSQDLTSAGKKTSVEWQGHDEDCKVWLADNVAKFDGDWLISPAYSTSSELAVNAVMSRHYAMSFVLFYMQVATCWMKGENIEDALIDPEVALSFSNTYVENDSEDVQPLRLLFMKGDNYIHFEVELDVAKSKGTYVADVETGKKRFFFNGQVTHAGQLVDPITKEGVVVCVCFEQPRVLLLKEAPFKEAIKGL